MSPIGADIDMPRSIGTLVRQVGIDAAQAISMATSIPANMLTLKGGYGLRKAASKENLLYMDREFNLKDLG